MKSNKRDKQRTGRLLPKALINIRTPKKAAPCSRTQPLIPLSLRCLQLRRTQPIWKKTRRPGRPNGYVLISSLICLFLSLQLCSLCSVYVLSKSRLMNAQKQSIIDLSIYSHARSMAAQHAYQARCNQSTSQEEDPSEPISSTETIDGISVTFTDRDSVIEASYQKGTTTILFQMFYTEKGVVSIRWNSEEET